MRAGLSVIKAGVVLERFKGYVFFITHAAGLPTSNPVNRKNAAVIGVKLGGPQQVLILSSIQADRHRVMAEQVNDRRAVQPHIVFAGADALSADLADIKAQGKASGAL